MLRKIGKDPVLLAACLLAVGSAFFVHPNAGYIDYIDFRVLVLLFCLMSVVAGLNHTGAFKKLGGILTGKVHTMRGIFGGLILLCFFSSMLITNDVALITFVPFTILMVKECGAGNKMILIIVLETLAANLGSMLTPIGNPQNLYLFYQSGIQMGDFLMHMLPLTVLSLVLILAGCLLIPKSRIVQVQTSGGESEQKLWRNPRFYLYGGLFLVCLLNVFHVIPYQAVLGIVIVGVLIGDYRLFARVDYSLLITFTGFFIFVGNLKEIEWISDVLSKLVIGKELFGGVILSQVISNVPAAMLLSGFTDNYKDLLWGVDIGGLGTIIASMASLISYKFYSNERDSSKGRYLAVFTGWNILFLVILMGAALLLK